MKRGQISLFIILAIVILVIIVGLMFFLKTKSEKDISQKIFSDQELNAKLKVLQGSFFNCLDSVTKESIDLITKQGGYYQKPTNYYEFDTSFIPYYYANGNIVPNNQIIESELSEYVDQNLIPCLEKVDKGIFNIDYELPKTVATIKDTILFNTDLFIGVNHEEQTAILELNEHPVEQQTTLPKKIIMAHSIIEQYAQNNNTICFTCVSDEAEEKELYVGIFSFDESSLIIRILDDPNDLSPLEFLIKYEEYKNEIQER